MPELLIASGIALTVLLLLVAVYLFFIIRPRAKAPQNAALLSDYAHRGLHGNGVPENSRAAFELACQKGVGIELDVQLSRDGVVMVYHDYDLSRLTPCDKKLCDLSAAELQRLPLAGTDETIPTFREVLSLVNGRVPLLIELKGEHLDSSLCPRVAELLKDYTGAYCIESFNPILLYRMRKLLPRAYYGLLYTNTIRDKKKLTAVNLAVSCMLLNFLARPNFIAYGEADRHSLPVRITTRLFRAPRFVWTIRSDESLAAAHALGEYPIFEHCNL